MGKSIRSKRNKRLRTIKRELVADHYSKKEAAKLAAQDAAGAAPKIEVLQRKQPDSMEVEEEPMNIDEEAANPGTKSLKAKGGIKKRLKGKSRKKIEKKKKKKKLNF